MARTLGKFEIGPGLRPCIAKGRRAFFHRWADSARPGVPRGVEETEEMEYFQIYSVHGIVEYEDGTVDRAWPFDIRFIDGGEFDQYAWPEEDAE